MGAFCSYGDYMNFFIISLCRVIIITVALMPIAQLDLLIAVLGIAASCVALCLAAFMFSINHKLARSFAIETIADVFASSCTTIFALHTTMGWTLHPLAQTILRFLILVPQFVAQIHMFLVIKDILNIEREVKND